MGNNLFYTGQRKRTSTGGGGISISMLGGDEIVKRLRKLEKGGENAIKRTVSDFSSRAPAWVSKGIRQHYGVDTGAIKKAGPKRRGSASTSVAGHAVAGAALVYEGETLTPTHFGMSPKQRPTALQGDRIRVPGAAIKGAGDVAMVRPPKKYSVKATIIKGQRTSLGDGTFINEGNGGVALPFQRKGAGRMPIEVVRTLSVPQMIDGRANNTIKENVSTELEKRFAHHVAQAMK